MSYEPLDYLRDKIEEERKSVIESLGDGSAKDYAEYQKAVGKVQGLLIAVSIVNDLAKNLEEFND